MESERQIDACPFRFVPMLCLIRFDSESDYIWKKEQVWLLLLHLTLNSIDYTTAFDNRSFHSFSLSLLISVSRCFVRNFNHKCSINTAQRQQYLERKRVQQSSFINPSIQLSDKCQIYAFMLSFKCSMMYGIRCR